MKSGKDFNVAQRTSSTASGDPLTFPAATVIGQGFGLYSQISQHRQNGPAPNRIQTFMRNEPKDFDPLT